MLKVLEQDIDQITEAIYLILKGHLPGAIEFPPDYPKNEVRQLVHYVNTFIQEYGAVARSLSDLSRGELEGEPSKGRLHILQSLKHLQANLRHLTWKTQQVAKGDFSQRVDFMGDFSEAFNAMTWQLKDAFETIERQNAQLRQAGERIRRDLDAAARVQRAMLPDRSIAADHACAAWAYEPTDELAGDALGLHLIDQRYLVAYVLDVSGHGVPAALLSVTAMHYLDPEPGQTSLLRDLTHTSGLGTVQKPSLVAQDLNRRFSPDNRDGRFFTMLLCVLDTIDGRLSMVRAGHPLPVIVRGKNVVPVPSTGGLPIAVCEKAEYEDVTIQLQPGDRVFLFSDGFAEQRRPSDDEAFGEERIADLLGAGSSCDLGDVVVGAVGILRDWAEGGGFADDVSLLAFEWNTT